MLDQRVDASVPDPLRMPGNVPKSSPSAVSAQSMIGKTISIKGEITGSESVQIEGHIEGSIVLPGDRVTVGPGGRVSATITAQDIVVQGEVTGSCCATKHLYVRREGSLCGDVITSRISVEEGAHLTGSIDIRKEAKPVVAKVEPQAQNEVEPQAQTEAEQELVESVN